MTGSGSPSPPAITVEDSLPPAVDETADDVKAGRKREREVSTEPSIIPNTAENEEFNARGRESQTKKNRTHLSAESDEDSPPRADGPLAATDSPLSPKVTQIRKRVKELSWNESNEPSASGSASDDDAPTQMGGVELSPEILTVEVVDNGPSDEQHDVTVPNANDASETTQGNLPADLKLPDHPPEGESVPAESTPASPPVTPPESEAEADAVPSLPSTADDSAARTDRTLKRKSRDSVFFAAGNIAEDESYKRAKDDPDNKSSQAEDTRQVPSTPPRTRSPNKFNGFAAYSAGPSPFLKGAPSKSFLDDPSSTPKSTSFSPFGGASSIFTKYSTPKTPSRTASPSPKPTFASGGFASFASKPPPYLGAASRASPTPSGSTLGSTAPGTPTAFGTPSARRASVPKPNEAFGSFSTGPTRFGTSTPKGAKSPKSDDESGEDEDAEEASAPPKASFDEILASSGGNDEESSSKVTNLEVIDVHTGEEHEMTLQQVRAKLYTMDSQDTYKEKGTGMLKVNVRKSDGKGARLVMRADGVLRLLINASLFHGMSCSVAQDPKFIKVSTLENGAFVHHAIKVGNPKAAQALVELIHENIPDASAPTPTKPATLEEVV